MKIKQKITALITRQEKANLLSAYDILSKFQKDFSDFCFKSQDCGSCPFETCECPDLNSHNVLSNIKDIIDTCEVIEE